MSNIINKAFMAGLGALSLTRDKVEEFVDDCVKRGELSIEEKSKVLKDLVEEGEKRKDEAQEFVQKEVGKVLETLNIPTRREINALKEEIEKLRGQQDKPPSTE